MARPVTPEVGAYSDGELVERARAGDGEAFDGLVRRYLRPALAVAWEVARSRDDAEDLVQEAFHKALVALPRFDTGRPFAPWFFTILRNTSRRYWSRAQRWQADAISEDLPDAAPDPLTRVEQVELGAEIQAGLDRLPEMQRACCRLVDLEGFSSPEVGEMLGLTDGTVRTHLHRGRRALRDVLRLHQEERRS